MDDQNLHIVELRVENFKRLKAVRIAPQSGKMVKLVGRNGHGKTSVIDAVAAGLGGKDYLPAVPVRVGQESGDITITLKDANGGPTGWLVRLHFEKDRYTTLTLVNEKGEKVTRGKQDMIDRLLSEKCLDPFELMMVKPAQRLQTLKALVPGFNFITNETDRRDAYIKRTDIGRDYRRDKALLDSTPVLDKRPEEIDVTAVAETLRVTEERERRRQSLEREIAMLRSNIEDWKSKINAALRTIIKLEDEIDTIEVDANTAELHSKLANAQETNRTVEQFDRRVTLLATLETHQNELRRLDRRIEELDAEKFKAVQDAKLPIPGLSLGEEDITIDQMPFEQASSSQQLMVATAIAMALRPVIRVILVRQGPLLDPEHIDILEKICAEHKYQLWLERIRDGAESGLIIEDGECLGEGT